MSERLWYYLHNNNQVGPVPESELGRLLARGAISGDTLVWSDLLTQWTPAVQTETFGAGGRAGVAAAGAEAPAVQAMLAPSELVLLHAEKFASKAGLISNGNFKLLHMEAEVSQEEVGKALFAVALLANEQQGVLQLKLTQKKALLGLRNVTVLVAEPAGGTVAWPHGSYEAVIAEMVAEAPREVADFYYTLLEDDSTNPWWESVHNAITAMDKRGLLLREETKKLIGKSVRLRARPEVISMAASQDISWIQQLLGYTQQARPDVWQLLQKAISSAYSRRRETPDFDDD
ncbi:MAG TPA: DUF4339 domain-containing protein [Symbiobacteriaceae bacterium]|nr:DUF4339 domain-containing protein [Symbiobacteriaceae bacterium]